jgi:hypothetical protein
MRVNGTSPRAVLSTTEETVTVDEVALDRLILLLDVLH